jgi:hypothetical protein
MMTDKDQGIVRDNNRGEEQPADKERAQNVASVEEKAKNERREKKGAQRKREWPPTIISAMILRMRSKNNRHSAR